MLAVGTALMVLLLPAGMTALHSTLVWNEVRSRTLYVILSGLMQYALMFVVFRFTLGRDLWAVGIAGGVPRAGSEPAWLPDTLSGMMGLLVATYILAGWLLQRALSNAMCSRGNNGGAA